MRPSKVVMENLLNKVSPEGRTYVVELLSILIDKMGKDILTMDTNKQSFSQLGVAKSKFDGAQLLLSRFIGEISKAEKKSD